MKNIVISADGDRKVFSVPDAVADNLTKHCRDFIKWLRNSPDAKKYRMGGVLCYDGEDFIEYLNVWIFQNQKSKLVKNLGWIDFNSKLPEPYVDCRYLISEMLYISKPRQFLIYRGLLFLHGRSCILVGGPACSPLPSVI